VFRNVILFIRKLHFLCWDDDVFSVQRFVIKTFDLHPVLNSTYLVALPDNHRYTSQSLNEAVVDK